MTRLLEKAVEQLKKLPNKEQDELAKLILQLNRDLNMFRKYFLKMSYCRIN